MVPDLDQRERAIQDTILQQISSSFVSVKDCDKTYLHHVTEFVGFLIKRMKELDKLFSNIMKRDMPSGSFWDGIKVGKPEEFDKNFVLFMPSSWSKYCQIDLSIPSFATMQVQREGLNAFRDSHDYEKYRKMENWLDKDNYILADKVKSWLESVVTKAINSFDPYTGGPAYVCSTRKSGPAMTVNIHVTHEDIKFDLDICPSFEFPPQKKPAGIRPFPNDNDTDTSSMPQPQKSWYLVPKPLRVNEFKGKIYPSEIQWRFSFHNQESEILKDTHHLKAVLKLMKKLRDNMLENTDFLTSYAIKTVFLWEKEAHPISFWEQSLTNLFLHMLEVLLEKLKQENIPFYFMEEHNLQSHLGSYQSSELYTRFRKVHQRITKALERGSDHLVIAKELLTDEEFNQFQHNGLVQGQLA